MAPSSSDFRSLDRVWESFANHTWCYPEEKDKQVGFLYVKVPKTGSSTNSGLAIRIARQVGKRKWPNEKGRKQICSLFHLHGSKRQAAQRERPSMTWTFLRDPATRELSAYFHFVVGRDNVTASDQAIIDFMRHHKGFQVSYTSGIYHPKLGGKLQQYGGAVGYVRERILHKYDFIGLAERRWESLALMKILWGLETSDSIVMNAKSSGGYDGLCFYIPKRPPLNPQVKDFIQNDFLEENLDYDLYNIANRSLDLTIHAIGRDVVHKEIQILRATQAYVENECLSKVIFPCSANGTKQLKLSKGNCYDRDMGCGYPCTNQLLSPGYTVPTKYYPN